MKTPLDAVTERLSHCARALFENSAAGWLTDLQPAISNPVEQLEQTLHKVLTADYTRETSDTPRAPARSGSRTDGRSSDISAQQNSGFPSSSAQIGAIERPQTRLQNPPHPQNIHTLNASPLPKHSPAPNTTTPSEPPRETQSTRLLTGINELQQLFRAVTSQQPNVTSANETTQTNNFRQEGAAQARVARLRPAADGGGDLSIIDEKNGATDLSGIRKQAGVISQSEQVLSSAHTSAETEHPQNSPRTPWAPDARDLRSDTFGDSPAGGQQYRPLAPTQPSDVSGPRASEDFPPFITHRHSASAHSPDFATGERIGGAIADDGDLQARIVAAITSLDSAAQDLLLEQLLDRLEDRQRDLVLRTLGFTGGQI